MTGAATGAATGTGAAAGAGGDVVGVESTGFLAAGLMGGATIGDTGTDGPEVNNEYEGCTWI
jgi:hypothetical protein